MTYLKNGNTILFPENISFFEIEDNLIVLNYRNKIKTHKIKTNITHSEFVNYINVNKITSIKKFSTIYINMNKIILIEEVKDKELSNPKNIWIRLVFEVDYLELELTRVFFNFWNQNNNIN
jgi:hypothetical protein